MSTMTERFDAIVVGAGPAGGTAARLLAREGGRVLLLDRATFPRDKPCGGGITFRADSENDVDFAPVTEREIYGVRTVVTRVKDPLRSELFARLGLRTFSPTKVGVQLAHDAIFEAGA